jgi:hypothetical protein
MKQVIFVSGTSWSGSTFFQLTLANDPKGFACGEIRHIFRPSRDSHIKREWQCGCFDPNCTVWEQVKARGEKHLYETIFELHPEVDFILDASKRVSWVYDMSNLLVRQGIEPRHVLIWKTPLEYASSLAKRNRLQELHNWARYHRLFYSTFDEWRSVQYARYVQSQEDVLRSACSYLDIPYFAGKERYWEKTHHVIDGNLSSRLHLYEKGSSGFADVQKLAGDSRTLEGVAVEKHRTIYYEAPKSDVVQQYVEDMKRQDPDLSTIQAMLEAFDVGHEQVPQRMWPSLQMGRMELEMTRARAMARETIGRIKLARVGNGK